MSLISIRRRKAKKRILEACFRRELFVVYLTCGRLYRQLAFQIFLRILLKKESRNKKKANNPHSPNVLVY